MSKLDELSQRITAAIFELEGAARNVSFLEEGIASLTSSSSVEGRIARRGAMRAAMISGDKERAKELVNRFLGEYGIRAKFKNKLKALLLS